jgi:SAM-dependent methyltransferase
MVLYAWVIFLGAFLLFQIQPLIAKIILPSFGGSSVVWSTCMLFFQVVLLLGYAYAHWLHEHLRASRQAIVHSALLLASIAVLPIGPDAAHGVSGVDHPSWQILRLLATTIGIPYFVLSSTSPLLQAWYARSRGKAPYRLYALSNVASMAALLSYPSLMEPNLTTRHQGVIWSIAYIGFAALCGATAWYSARAVTKSGENGRTDAVLPASPPRWRLLLLWIALAACGSILLLAVTTFLTQDVAAIPFLWVLPLSVYLLTFIICFDSPRLYARSVFYPLLAAALGLLVYLLKHPNGVFKIGPTVMLAVSALFFCCMVCHGELVRLKPHPRYLTLFYTMLSVGGAIGGIFVALVAPNVFSGYEEFPIGLALCAILAASLLLASHQEWFRRLWGRVLTGGVVAAVTAYLVLLGIVVHDSLAGFRVARRNFYGQLRVEDSKGDEDNFVHRKLLHGVINHGEQILDAKYRREPISYFCHGTGIAYAMLAGKSGVPRKIGILGLGCGTLAAYGRSGDTIRIYEINPLVLEIARSEFTYLSDTPAHVETVLGDGRLSLEREPSQQFDVLVMDAFSGDSVPVHLITREAFETYLRHLKPGGILAVNVSNKHLDLRPVMERGAAAVGRIALFYSYDAYEEDTFCKSADWVLITEPGVGHAKPALYGAGQVLKPYTGFRPWTDDFSNMFRILK